MHRLAVVSAIAVLAGTPAFDAAEAAVLNMKLTGSCNTFPHSPPSCANVGLPLTATGIPLGSVQLDDSAFSPGGFFENEALVSYSFAFGNFSLSKLDVPNPQFAGVWGETPGTVAILTLNAYASADREKPGPLVTLGLGNTIFGDLVASHDGYRQPIPGGGSFETDNGNWAGFRVDREIAPIPLPAPLLLLASGLAGLLALRRPSRRAGAAA